MMFNITHGWELINNTTSEWISINGVNGRKFINKTDSSKYIFLPASGVWSSTYHAHASEDGYSWSTGIYTSDISRALVLSFSSSTYMQLGHTQCYYGYPIRPVAPPHSW